MYIKPQNEYTLEDGLDLSLFYTPPALTTFRECTGLRCSRFLKKIRYYFDIHNRKLPTTGSVLHINEHLDEPEDHLEPSTERQNVDYIGHKIGSFATLADGMIDFHPGGFVKKRILEAGGGLPLKEPCTVFIAFSGYFDNTDEPFDVHSMKKPLEVNLTMTDYEDHGLIPGLDIAIKSMLVGELSIFLFSHEFAYGEYGIPPRIPPKAQCAFYIKLVKKTLTSQNKKINFSERNMFDRVDKEVKNFYAAGSLLYQSNNFTQAANVFRKAIWMLHKCRLADEAEEKKQEKWLKKLYYNSAVCYNKAHLPLKACTACNELNQLQNLWNNSKALFQNAKALRMIGQYDAAEKRLKRAMKLCSNSHYDDMTAEMELLIKTKESCNQKRLMGIKLTEKHIASDDFKKEVDALIRDFKENVNLCQLTLPSGMGSCELKYLREACIRENLFMRSVDVPLEIEAENQHDSKHYPEPFFAIDKEDNLSSCDGKSERSQDILCDGEGNHENLMKEMR